MVSEANPDNLASGSEELAAEQEKMTSTTTKLLAVVSELGGGLGLQSRTHREAIDRLVGGTGGS